MTEASHETSILRLQNLEVPTKTRRKTSILKLQSVKIGGSLARHARFGAQTCLVSRHWFYGGFAVSMGENWRKSRCQISQVMFSGDPSANKQKQSLVFEQRVGKVFKMQGSSSST